MDSYSSITPDGGDACAAHMDWAFTQSPFALAIHDRDLLCLRVNDRMCQMFGLTEDELRGRRLTDVLPGPQYGALERYIARCWTRASRHSGKPTAGYRVRPANAPGRFRFPR